MTGTDDHIPVEVATLRAKTITLLRSYIEAVSPYTHQNVFKHILTRYAFIMRVTVNHSADIIHGLKAPRTVKNPYESERLVYRCYEPEDFETVLELHSNPQVYLN
jgi:hypothetical protein